MKVVICGSPQWTYEDIVKHEIDRLRRESRASGKKLLIIHGGEYGPETIAHEYCKFLGIDTIVHEAVRVLGRNSYFRRNEIMLNYHKPDLVVGFAHSLKENSVVLDMIRRAEIKKIETRPIDSRNLRKLFYGGAGADNVR